MARPMHHKRHAAVRRPDCKPRRPEPSSERSEIIADIQSTPQVTITKHVYVACSCQKCGRTDINPEDVPAREAPACLEGAVREPEERAMPKCAASGAASLTENPDDKDEAWKVKHGKGAKAGGTACISGARRLPPHRKGPRQIWHPAIPCHHTQHPYGDRHEHGGSDARHNGGPADGLRSARRRDYVPA